MNHCNDLTDDIDNAFIDKKSFHCLQAFFTVVYLLNTLRIFIYES